MRTRLGSEVINEDRRQLLSTAAIGIAAAGAASLFPAYPAPAAKSDAIRPFRINVPEEDLVDLRRRIAATRWPEKETVTDKSQGVQLATIRSSRAIGRQITTGARWRRGSTPCRSSSPRSMGSTFISFMSVRNMKRRCRSSSRTDGPARSSSS